MKMTTKTINLISLINAKNDLSPEIFDAYLTKMEVSLKVSEAEDLAQLVGNLKSITLKRAIFSNYYIGFKIKQIGKEFDLLRFGSNYHVNIELKGINTGEAIAKQLKKNKYYLKSLDKEVYYFTYVASENRLYFLQQDDSIIEVDFEFLVNTLTNQELIEIEDLNTLFEPTEYLVSPFNSTERFINGEYFLTQLQDSFKKELNKLIASAPSNLFSIEGAAGTGKTLLVYDFAKQYINMGKKVAIIHCGNLNEGHNILIYTHSWNIIHVREYKEVLQGQFDLVIIDEVQRIYKNQLQEIIDYAITNQITCVFSFDPKQCLHKHEISRNIPEYLDSIVQKKFKLTEKIRTNPEINSFIKNLFSLSSQSPEQIYKNIDIQYFSHIDEANGFIHSLKLNDWTTIGYTLSNFKKTSLDDIQVHSYENAHSVIGQEFDKVIAIMGDSFYYSSDGKLMGDFRSYYHSTKMLFQILTRARKKICLIIINNEPILEKCLKILENSKTKKKPE